MLWNGCKKNQIFIEEITSEMFQIFCSKSSETYSELIKLKEFKAEFNFGLTNKQEPDL